MKKTYQPLAIALSMFTLLDVVTSQPARADHSSSFNFGNFAPSASSLITTNGNAELTDGVLRLTPDEGSQFGSAFFNTPFSMDANTSFSSHFQFRIHGERAGTPDGADGLVFVIQNDPRGVSALGTDGSGLGYGFGGSFGDRPITPSVGIALDTFPFQLSDLGNVSLLQNTSISLAEAFLPFNFASGNPLNIWVDYNGTTDLLEIFLAKTASKPSSPLLTQTLAIDSIVGSQAFFGFSAATGARFNIHDIEHWKLSFNQPVPEQAPEPSTALALALGGSCFFVSSRHKRHRTMG